ncbi:MULTISPECIES: hypothetical protein [Mesonia]|uniref:Uncharacterized protein n=1 Tax=Mesonia oceanica TaxID=2687242 RepID=A0AC61Y3P3_9FLAO|nr:MULTISPECIES: hypothetical protein [Mesonia]MAN26915.1 hypothetical protein [Mesonia sp.]MAQ40749.1 hypothetical protein [Mesonia sp.]MBJ98454.1 hypothetical protein [Flavobacteriaceae bacterium]VVU99084.1 hypothetical protein FVB9532_00335 [Mesonia oceanica]
MDSCSVINVDAQQSTSKKRYLFDIITLGTTKLQIDAKLSIPENEGDEYGVNQVTSHLSGITTPVAEWEKTNFDISEDYDGNIRVQVYGFLKQGLMISGWGIYSEVGYIF